MPVYIANSWILLSQMYRLLYCLISYYMSTCIGLIKFALILRHPHLHLFCDTQVSYAAISIDEP